MREHCENKMTGTWQPIIVKERVVKNECNKRKLNSFEFDALGNAQCHYKKEHEKAHLVGNSYS